MSKTSFYKGGQFSGTWKDFLGNPNFLFLKWRLFLRGRRERGRNIEIFLKGMLHTMPAPDKRAHLKVVFLISQQKHVVGTQKNCLNETILLSTQTHVYKLIDKKIITILHLKVLCKLNSSYFYGR